ncbi:hypothetical protein EDC04DRAFT_2616036 [Pisolithus marmoratus]|nr:hypothetical protein EDC04DRAFT_2616036 [Pisolithus marmoratus]
MPTTTCVKHLNAGSPTMACGRRYEQLPTTPRQYLCPKMPLDPLPPPSPCGKSLAPSTCQMLARGITLSLRALSELILSLQSSPIWTWMTKDGPNKGKSFQVPTIPIVCEKTAPHAVHWVVTVFHSFKTHLHPVTIDTDTGKVHQGWLRLYQNNLYVHLRSQLKVPPPPLPPRPSLQSTCTPKATPSVVPSTTATDPVAKLQAEISSLNPSPSASLEDGSNKESTPRYVLKKIEDNTIEAFINPPTWLATGLKAPDLPTCFTGKLIICCPMSLGPPPRDALEAIKLKFGGSSPFYLRVSQNGHLTVSAMAERSLVTNSFMFPPDPSVPMACP